MPCDPRLEIRSPWQPGTTGGLGSTRTRRAAGPVREAARLLVTPSTRDDPMKIGDMVICEMQKSGAPIGTVEMRMGLVLSQPKPRYPGEAVMWHGWNVLVDGVIIPFPERFLEVHSEAR